MAGNTAIQSGFTKDEMAEMEGLDESDVEVEAEAPLKEEADQGEPEAEASAPAPTSTPAASPKRPDGYVPVAALHEARLKEREAIEKAARLEGAFHRWQQELAERTKPQEVVPDYTEDPLGNVSAELATTKRQLMELSGTIQQRQQMEAEQSRAQQLLDQYANSTRNFAKGVPDFKDAYDYLAKSRDEELEALGFDDPLERHNRIQYDEGMIVARAMQLGRDPARMLYDYATKRGWKSPSANPAPSKIERLTAGTKAARTVGGSGGGLAEEGMTLERLSELYDEDPKEADKQWERLHRKGMLG